MARGCKALGYRLSGPAPVNHMCVRHLRDSLRLVVAFEGQRAWILLVGRHDDQDQVLNVYAEPYRLLGAEPPDSAGRDKPPCCDESTDLPPVLGAAVTEFVERAATVAGQGASRRRYGYGTRRPGKGMDKNSALRYLPSAHAAKSRSHQTHGHCGVTFCHRPLCALRTVSAQLDGCAVKLGQAGDGADPGGLRGLVTAGRL